MASGGVRIHCDANTLKGCCVMKEKTCAIASGWAVFS
jgi:hypothetical protein